MPQSLVKGVSQFHYFVQTVIIVSQYTFGTRPFKTTWHHKYFPFENCDEKTMLSKHVWIKNEIYFLLH